MKKIDCHGWAAWPGLFLQLGIAGLLGLTMVVMAVSEVWAAQASPASLTFQAVQGGPNPANQMVVISKNTYRQVGWKASDNASWLSATPGSGTLTTSTQLGVAVNVGGLAAGTYSGSLTVMLSKGGSVAIPVTLTVAPAKSLTSGTTATLSWVPNTDSDLAGYKVYMGTSSGVYGPPVDVGNVTTYVAGNLKAGTTYYFSVTAYDQSKNESIYSSEVSKSIY